MSRHENLNKKRKKWRYVYRKFRITRRFNIEDTKGRNQIRVMEVYPTAFSPLRGARCQHKKKKKLHKERRYEGSHILFLESKAQSMFLQI